MAEKQKPKRKSAAKKSRNLTARAVADRAKPEPPEWLMDTPEIIYHLMADDHDNGDWKQNIELTYAEYDALKDHLGRLRGIEVPAKEATHA